MEARELIDMASFRPDTLNVVHQAFDDAWSEIVADYDDPQAEAARTKLAVVLLSVANEDSTNSGSLKRLALEMLATQKL